MQHSAQPVEYVRKHRQRNLTHQRKPKRRPGARKHTPHKAEVAGGGPHRHPHEQCKAEQADKRVAEIRRAGPAAADGPQQIIKQAKEHAALERAERRVQLKADRNFQGVT